MIKLNHEDVLNMLKQSEYAAKQSPKLRLKVLRELLKIAKENNLKILEIIVE